MSTEVAGGNGESTSTEESPTLEYTTLDRPYPCPPLIELAAQDAVLTIIDHEQKYGME